MGSQSANKAEFQDGGMPVAQPMYQVDVNGNPISSSNPIAAGVLSAGSNNIGAVQQATSNAAIPAGSGTSAQVIKGAKGYLSGMVVTATGTANLVIYDNASAGSGSVIGVIPSTATLGQYFPLNMPAQNGITAALVSGSPAVTVAYS